MSPICVDCGWNGTRQCSARATCAVCGAWPCTSQTGTMARDAILAKRVYWCWFEVAIRALEVTIFLRTQLEWGFARTTIVFVVRSKACFAGVMAKQAVCAV